MDKPPCDNRSLRSCQLVRRPADSARRSSAKLKHRTKNSVIGPYSRDSVELIIVHRDVRGNDSVDMDVGEGGRGRLPLRSVPRFIFHEITDHEFNRAIPTIMEIVDMMVKFKASWKVHLKLLVIVWFIKGL